MNNNTLIIIPTMDQDNSKTFIQTQKIILEKNGYANKYYYVVNSPLNLSEEAFYLDFEGADSINQLDNMIKQLKITHVQIHLQSNVEYLLMNNFLENLIQYHSSGILIGVWLYSTWVDKKHLLKYISVNYIAFNSQELYEELVDNSFKYHNIFLFPNDQGKEEICVELYKKIWQTQLLYKHMYDLHQQYDNKYLIDFSELEQSKPMGLSGYIRTRNEAHFLPTCIDSIIDSVDELIIVYNQCEDNTIEVLNTYQKKYPNKIKYYEYEPEVYPARTLEYALTFFLSPHSLANFSNFALSKTNYKYVMKVDSDHFYFSNIFKTIYKALYVKRSKLVSIVMNTFSLIIKVYHKITRGKKHYQITPLFFRNILQKLYIYSKTYLYKDTDSLALTGINIGYIKNEGFFSFDTYPSVGHGDLVIVKRNAGCYTYVPNYEIFATNTGCVFLAVSFWHGRYQKHVLWDKLGVQYNSFHDSDGTYIPWWKEYPLAIPQYPSKPADSVYIPIPKNELITLKEVGEDWVGVHKRRNCQYIGEITEPIFWGFDAYPSPLKYKAVQNYIKDNKLNINMKNIV